MEKYTEIQFLKRELEKVRNEPSERDEVVGLQRQIYRLEKGFP
jgi:hypothetical protein